MAAAFAAPNPRPPDRPPSVHPRPKSRFFTDDWGSFSSRLGHWQDGFLSSAVIE
jgi:hypothetical protein